MGKKVFYSKWRINDSILNSKWGHHHQVTGPFPHYLKWEWDFWRRCLLFICLLKIYLFLNVQKSHYIQLFNKLLPSINLPHNQIHLSITNYKGLGLINLSMSLQLNLLDWLEKCEPYSIIALFTNELINLGFTFRQ